MMQEYTLHIWMGFVSARSVSPTTEIVSNESRLRATFPEGILQFIFLKNTYTYTSVGCGSVVYFWFCLYIFIKYKSNLFFGQKYLI